MKKSDIDPNPNLAIPTIPVICDRCKAEGAAGHAAFAGVADILNFEPVPRRAQVNAWTPEHQRAFIAALAITGSAKRAAAAIGRHVFGADQLRKARGGRGFLEAWDAALDIAREREIVRLRGKLSDLSCASEPGDEPIEPLPHHLQSEREPAWGTEEAYEAEERAQREAEEARQRMRDRMMRARRLLLWGMCEDAEMRAAWETLVGPVDWEKAAKLEPQDNEPLRTSMRKADMILAAEAGVLADVIGGENALAELTEAVEREGPRVRRLEG